MNRNLGTLTSTTARTPWERVLETGLGGGLEGGGCILSPRKRRVGFYKGEIGGVPAVCSGGFREGSGGAHPFRFVKNIILVNVTLVEIRI